MGLYKTILCQSAVKQNLKSFHTFRWSSSFQEPDQRTKTFWELKSNFRKFKLIEYMKMNLLLGSPSHNEMRLCFDAPGVLIDPLLFDALRAKNFGTELNLLLHRLGQIQEWIGKPRWSMNLYYTYNNALKFVWSEIRIPIRKVKPFSGYVKSSSSVGSKNSKGIVKAEPERFEWTNYEELDYFQYLTVGSFPGEATWIYSPDDESKEIRNGD